MKLKPEEAEQVEVVQWLEVNRYRFTAFPHETYTKSWSQKNKNTRMGVKAGVPDLMILLKRGAILFIEMKAPKLKLKNGTWKENWREGADSRGGVKFYQKEWIEALNDINYVQAEVCYSSEEAIELIKRLEK